MRDIRPDLEERIKSMERERDEHETKVALLDQQLVMLKGLLEQENGRWGEQEHTLRFDAALWQRSSGESYSSPVAASVLSTLRNHNTASLELLKADAARNNVFFGGKNPGRVIHFLLLGMEQNELVERMPNKEWRLRGKTAAAS